MGKSNSVFITKLKMRKDKNGADYLIGSMGLGTIMIRPHRTNEGEWNFFIMESRKKEEGNNRPPGTYGQSGGGYGGPANPPEQNYEDEVPF